MCRGCGHCCMSVVQSMLNPSVVPVKCDQQLHTTPRPGQRASHPTTGCAALPLPPTAPAVSSHAYVLGNDKLACCKLPATAPGRWAPSNNAPHGTPCGLQLHTVCVAKKGYPEKRYSKTTKTVRCIWRCAMLAQCSYSNLQRSGE
jgi:hypothetical protein